MSSTDSAAQKMIVLKSFDGETFEVEESVVVESQTIKHMIEPNVTSKILAKIIEYCKCHAKASTDMVAEEDSNLKTFDAEFGTLFDMILAANYLNIKGLHDLTCQIVANMIKEKTPEEIHKTFNITNDFTPEEEDEIRRESAWAFEC